MTLVKSIAGNIDLRFEEARLWLLPEANYHEYRKYQELLEQELETFYWTWMNRSVAEYLDQPVLTRAFTLGPGWYQASIAYDSESGCLDITVSRDYEKREKINEPAS